MKIFKKMKKGFTLVELVVVIAVIAILAAVSVGAYFGVTDSANASKLEQEAKQVHTAIQTVSLAPNEHSSLTSSGLTITDAEAFEDALEKNLGVNVFLTNEANKKDDDLPTIYFLQDSLSNLVEENKLYKSFDYHLPEIGNKKASGDVVTGDVKAVASNAEVFDGETKPDSGDTSVPGESTTEPGGEPVDPETNYYWYQVREARELKADDQIVIVAANDNYAMSATHSDNGEYRPQVEITKQDNRITSVEDVQIITLEAGTVEGTFAFNVGEKYLTSTTGSNNHLKETNEIDKNASWSITINKGTASVIAQGSGTRKTIKYNEQSTRFSCYASGQHEISIYKYGEYTPCTHSFGDNLPECEYCGETNPNYEAPTQQLHVISIPEALEIAQALDHNEETYDFYQISGTVIREKNGNNTYVYLTDGTAEIQVYKSNTDSYENFYQGYSVTVKGLLKKYNSALEIVDYEIISYTPVTYTITINNLENGSITATQTSNIVWGTEVTFTITPEENYYLEILKVNNVETSVSENTFVLIVETDVVITAEFKENTPDTPVATKYTMKHNSSTTANMTGNNDASTYFDLSTEDFNIKSIKNKPSNQAGLNKDGTIRLYANKADGDGTALHIEVLGNKTIQKIEIIFGSTVGTFTVNGVTGSKNTKTYNIKSNICLIKNTTVGSDSTQVYIESIDIYVY